MTKRIIANIAAVALLGGSLVYYNFIDKPPESPVEVGVECPNFIAKPYMTKGTQFSASTDVFTLVKQRGKICIVNFWETWCAACVQEMPHFNQIQEEYEGAVEVVAIVGTTSTMDGAAKWMSNGGWKTYDKESDWTSFSLTFAYLPTADCKALGVSGMLPRTIIVDDQGVVAYAEDRSITYGELNGIVAELLLSAED